MEKFLLLFGVLCFLSPLFGQRDTASCLSMMHILAEHEIFLYQTKTMPARFGDTLVFRHQDIKYEYQKKYQTALKIEPLYSVKTNRLEDHFYAVSHFREKVTDSTGKEDTILLKRYTSYFPFKGKYLMYCDCKSARMMLSGHSILSYFRYASGNETDIFVNTSSAALFRMFSFGVDQEKPLLGFTRTFPDEKFDWFYTDSCSLSFNAPAIIRVPSVKVSYDYNRIEVLFYTDSIPSPLKSPLPEVDTKNYDPNEEIPARIPVTKEIKDFYEVKYTIINEPKSYEETLIPRFRKLSTDEKQSLISFLESQRISPFYFFIDSKTLYEKMAPYHLLPQK